MEVLERFGEPTRLWFGQAFGTPTPAQSGAWDAISQGRNALVVAPTGSGKTLAAFLWAIDRVFRERGGPPGGAAGPDAERGGPPGNSAPGADATAADRTRILYVSPLKALGVDVERNLRMPLAGIERVARERGLEPLEVRVAVRSGDTPSSQRQRLLRKPPDILITTPESLYLMLTSRARQTLRGVHTVIVDEVHAVAGSKRGAHLAVSLERLDSLLPAPAQRIGLSATVRPVEEVARFLGGAAPVDVVAPQAGRSLELTVTVPVAGVDGPALDAAGAVGPALEEPDAEGPALDAAGSEHGPALATADSDGPAPDSGVAAGSIWPRVEESVVDQVLEHRSTIVFVNSRRLAERLTSRLNEAYVRRLGLAGEEPPDGGEWAELGRGLSADAGGLADTGGLDNASGPESSSGGLERARAADGHGSSTGSTPPGPRQAGESAGGPPAQTMGASGQSQGAPPVLARAHHGSVAKEQRAQVEEELKSGKLRCVVATSSLELGIDMGAVDLVIQIESPPSAASGLQRVGRAGHQVGGVSRATFYPKHSGDVLHSAVVAERMLHGQIEALAIPRNPLDILAQQTVAECANASVDVQRWFETVRRSAPFHSLPRSAFDTVLDFLAGRYPSDEFAELRPRLVWDREAGTITGRPGAQRLAVTSGGTIPDRGMYGVFVAGQERGGRVGELDEEMVYESRVGDVFTLGTTSWRIVEITHDRVNVAPAFGRPGRLPFWRAEGQGRPAELGQAMGRFYREISEAPESEAATRLAKAGLDAGASGELLRYLREQRAATGTLPTDRALTVERGRDDVGDWRLILHSPYGLRVHAPWALAISARIRERHGTGASAVASDDGIVVRVSDTSAHPPGAELFAFDPADLERIVTEEVGGSALFASRFRECAARSLLMPRLNPGKRMPLWQQRQRSAGLLEVARRHPGFPVVLEALREVLQDVYDVPSLLRLARDIAAERIRLVETETDRPSPFARDLLFAYVDQFIYEGDSPLAERRAALLQVDPELLGDLLGRVEMRELLDAGVIAQYEAQVQRLAPGRRARGVEGVADLLRQLGPLSVGEVAARLEPEGAKTAEQEEASPEEAPWNATKWDGDPAGLGCGEGFAGVAGMAGAAGLADAPSLESAESMVCPDRLDDPARPDGSTADLESAESMGATAGLPYAQECLDELVGAGRAIGVPIVVGGRQWWRYAAIEDAARLRDGLGVPLPRGIARAFLEPVARPVDDLVSRFARTHGPFTAADVAARYGLGVAVVRESLHRLRDERRVTSGFFLPERRDDSDRGGEPSGGGAGSAAQAWREPVEIEWCDVDALRRLRQRSLAVLRGEVEPVSPQAYARFLPVWQHADGSLEGVDGVLAVVEQLAGVAIPASAWESLVLPARVRDYTPSMLDQLTSSGEVVWAGCGALPGRDGWLALYPAGYPAAPGEGEEDGVGGPALSVPEKSMESRILAALSGGGAYFAAQLREAAGGPATEGQAFSDAIWKLVWAGYLTNDTLAPVRAFLAHGTQAHRTARTPRPRHHRGRGYGAMRNPAASSPLLTGRWSLLPTVTGSAMAGDAGAARVAAASAGAGPAGGTRPGPPPTVSQAEAPTSLEAEPASVLQTAPPDASQAGLASALSSAGSSATSQTDPATSQVEPAAGTGRDASGARGMSGARNPGGAAQAPDVAAPDATAEAAQTAVAEGAAGHTERAAEAAREAGAAREADAARAVEAAWVLLDRYGVVTRGAVQAEQVTGGFARMYRVLCGFEDAGHCRRGYFVEGLGAAQFAAPATVDLLREFGALPAAAAGSRPPASRERDNSEPGNGEPDAGERDGAGTGGSQQPGVALAGSRVVGSIVTLAATDPANAYGAALPWPAIDGVQHRPGRKAGALVVLADGAPVLYVERGGRTVLQFTDEADVLEAACRSLASTAASKRLETLTIERINGDGAVFRSPLAPHLRSAGFVETPRGLTLRRAY